MDNWHSGMDPNLSGNAEAFNQLEQAIEEASEPKSTLLDIPAMITLGVAVGLLMIMLFICQVVEPSEQTLPSSPSTSDPTTGSKSKSKSKSKRDATGASKAGTDIELTTFTRKEDDVTLGLKDLEDSVEATVVSKAKGHELEFPYVKQGS